MKTQNIIAFSATLLLSSCGIYSSYQPQTSVPENLYGEEVAVSDTNSIGNHQLARLLYRSLFAGTD